MMSTSLLVKTGLVALINVVVKVTVRNKRLRSETDLTDLSTTFSSYVTVLK